MPFLPSLVGEITVKQRKSRYSGEPVYKTLSFVKQKPKKTERWEVIRTGPAAQHIHWDQLSPEQQQYFWEQYQQQQWSAHHHHHASVETITASHHKPLLEMEPEIKLIKPKPKDKKVDAGYTIFAESDTESTYSGSSRTSFGSSKSSRSGTSSSSSKSSRSSGIGPVTGW